MKTDTLTLSPESVAEYLPDCKPGEQKKITLTIEVSALDESGLTAAVSDIGYDEEAGEPPAPPSEEEGEPEAMPMMEKPMKARRPAAVMAILGKPSKK